ncbi:tetratricopeptide repeat protein [Candidatus Entotheonella palauensis]|uniref:Uncharacterized protein n=1 Tax=Candidatus Entotheonella gemina TaxID=1429439 RepID=W4LSK5_9BACT|nr:tetratricopeptide repeat protein [Candidatus Entotheonella palauensis]ETX00397.1 MAG: hypothetical protein ETSY2_39155 [Candidatus Entotheonella gemina]
MTREVHNPHEDEYRDPDIDAAIRILVDQAQSPPQFAARIRAQLAQRPTRSESLRLWVAVLATGFVLSLVLNVWWGTLVWRLVSARHAPSGTPLISHQSTANATVPPTGNTIDTLLLRRLAEAYLQAGHYAKARDAATAALVLNPDDAQAYGYRGTAQAALGKQEQAVQDWRHAAQLGDAEAHTALIAYERQNRI